MAKFAKVYRGAVNGNPFPTEFKPGDDCPASLEHAAHLAGVLDEVEEKPANTGGGQKPANTGGGQKPANTGGGQKPANTGGAQMPGVNGSK